MDTVTIQAISHTTSTTVTPCSQTRMIEDVFPKNKKRTGKIRCLECESTFGDSCQAQK